MKKTLVCLMLVLALVLGCAAAETAETVKVEIRDSDGVTVLNELEIEKGAAVTDLGVTKDGVATVDLVRSLEWEQQFFDDCRRLESFRDDPVVSKAVETLRQELEQTVPQEDITMGGM